MGWIFDENGEELDDIIIKRCVIGHATDVILGTGKQLIWQTNEAAELRIGVFTCVTGKLGDVTAVGFTVRGQCFSRS